METLRVTVRMAKPICALRGGIHLDGIMAAGAYQMLTREEKESLPPITSEWAVDLPLPLQKWERTCLIPRGVHPNLYEKVGETSDGRTIGVLWGWCASLACVTWAFEALEPMRKRPVIDMAIRHSSDTRMETASGPFKAQDKKFPMRYAHELTWYCVGDKAEVERVLSFVTHIGRGNGHGWGAIQLDENDLPMWTVESWPYDWSIVGPGGHAMRAMPRQDSPLIPALQHTAIRAPYHHSSRRFPTLSVDMEIMPCR